ncbi:2-oxo-4-hydroxy-4-carboxy-5-ureidoimidazoline decarboxylase [Bailinhaonella thermotolerans]|uniref:2-oxo-4-hydroxy-4-carboxy-5-ureidoimidazoline decarboxylase n=1 Tax=Bailinhaonella thermotolerans TaxID=1070861 RepID=UPI00241305EF|nr:2-oxo-4-hydroxy-4-carboxy-5-ureidoimidazoline decarboxylase [Bailinhaonella thermotolerans]
MVLDWFNALAPEKAEAELLACCASRAWAKAVAGRRPYGDLAALTAAARAEIAGLSWADVEEALNAHPRIGDRAAGESREAGWSRREQAGMADAAEETARAMAEGNLAYEERFGHVFLIRAAGRGAEEMLAELRRRLGNDPETERAEVRGQLAGITELRLAKLLGEEAR